MMITRILATKLPFFMVVNITPWIILALLFNLLYDGGLMSFLMAHYKVRLKKDVKIRTILMAWVFGFVGDICTVIVLLIFGKLIPSINLYNLFSSITGMIFSGIVLIISFTIVYNMIKYLLGRVYVHDKKARRISLVMALLTVPYYILLPVSFNFNSPLG